MISFTQSSRAGKANGWRKEIKAAVASGLTARWNEGNILYLDTHRVTQVCTHLSKITEWDT